MWMDPGFFADPDRTLKNPDPSVFCFNLLKKYQQKLLLFLNLVLNFCFASGVGFPLYPEFFYIMTQWATTSPKSFVPLPPFPEQIYSIVNSVYVILSWCPASPVPPLPCTSHSSPPHTFCSTLANFRTDLLYTSVYVVLSLCPATPLPPCLARVIIIDLLS